MEHFELQSLLTLGILIICGYFGGLLANVLKFPRETGYITAGFLLSPSLSGIISAEMIEGKLSMVTDLALAIIAYSIGGSLIFSRLKRLVKSIFWINVSQSLGAFFFTSVLILCWVHICYGLLSPLTPFGMLIYRWR